MKPSWHPHLDASDHLGLQEPQKRSGEVRFHPLSIKVPLQQSRTEPGSADRSTGGIPDRFFTSEEPIWCSTIYSWTWEEEAAATRSQAPHSLTHWSPASSETQQSTNHSRSLASSGQCCYLSHFIAISNDFSDPLAAFKMTNIKKWFFPKGA